MKNLIVGVIDNLPWERVRPWAVSLRKSGFVGDILILGYRMNELEVRKGCEKFGFKLEVLERDDQGRTIDHTRGGLETQAFRWRNYHLWQYLQEHGSKYDFVALLDTSDLVFQSNPDDFLKTLQDAGPAVYLPGEGVLIEDEEWTARLIREHYADEVFEKVRKSEACNGGTMFGTTKEFQDFMLKIFHEVRDVDVIGIDQPAMNVLGESTSYAKRLPMTAGWACQCGTMFEPRNRHFRLVCPRPEIRNFIAYNGSRPFVLLHQYPRIPELRERVAWKYIGVPMKRQLWYRAMSKGWRMIFGRGETIK